MLNNNVKSNADHKLIYDLLKTKSENDIVTFLEIKDVCLKREEKYLRSSINRALYNLLKDGVVYHNVRNIGYKRANSSEIIDKSPSFLRAAYRRLKRNKLTLEVTNDNDLTQQEKILKNTYYAVSGTLMYLLKPKQIKLIQQKSMNNELSFDPKESLNYLNNNI